MSRAAGYCIPCKSNVRAGHAATAKHERSTRPAEYRQGAGDWLEARPPRPVRDWDAEEREYRAQESTSREVFTDALIRFGPLPEPPALQYPSGMTLISLKDAGERLGLSPETMRSAIHRGKMTGHKYGRDWLVEESEVAWYEMRSLGRRGRPKKKSA